ncbi:MAG: peptidase [Acidovorax sp. SCN 68-22]|nr:MAG: peptidase [Acidovorax sp. SCN 68-22]
MGRARLTALAAALVLVSAARAEVVEAHAHAPYAVHARADQSLREALNAATPITVDGRRFHGHTQWNVHWNFWWHEDAAGRCRITRVRTRLATRLQMPELRRATPAQAARFARYERALRAHEEGHVQLGRDAAQAIDRGIAALPAAGSCAALEERANALGRRLLAEHAARDKHYDRATGHGASQGAQLD